MSSLTSRVQVVFMFHVQMDYPVRVPKSPKGSKAAAFNNIIAHDFSYQPPPHSSRTSARRYASSLILVEYMCHGFDHSLFHVLCLRPIFCHSTPADALFDQNRRLMSLHQQQEHYNSVLREQQEQHWQDRRSYGSQERQSYSSFPSSRGEDLSSVYGLRNVQGGVMSTRP